MSVLTNNNEPLTQSDGKVYSDIPNGENDFYYHRYKDDGFNKFYLSSKYLKDAVISDTNIITSINDSIGGYPSGGGAHSLSNNALRTNATITGINASLVLGFSDFFTGFWINPLGDSIGEFWRNQIYISYYLSGGKYKINFLSYTVDSGLVTQDMPTYEITEGWAYIAVFRKNGLQYITGNGILYSIKDMTLYEYYKDTIQLGYNKDCLYDNAFQSIGNSIIDPTGYAIGDKVFEPPMRGGFDSIIKQY